MKPIGKVAIGTFIVAPPLVTAGVYELHKRNRNVEVSTIEKERDDLKEEKRIWTEGLNSGEKVVFSTSELEKLKRDRETLQSAKKVFMEGMKKNRYWAVKEQDFDLVKGLE